VGALVDVAVIGGGQAGLAVGFYLARAPGSPSFVILDAEPGPGGAWRHAWDSLRLFSPARWSSLPGRLMPGGADTYPSRDEALAYLADYEAHYRLPVRRPVRVHAVERADEGRLRVRSDAGDWLARAVVSATGSWAAPFVPEMPGRAHYGGRELHSAHYRTPLEFAGRRVVVVGGGNSGAQVLADLLDHAEHVTWATLHPPRFLPDDVDGRVLFDQATERYRAQREGRPAPPARSLGDVVMVAPVRAARERGALGSVPMFTRFTSDGVEWPDGSATREDAVIWCTGFRPALAHLAPLGLVDARGRVAVQGTRAAAEPRLWLVGYGEWTGFASATLIGVGRGARSTVLEISALLAGEAPGGTSITG
jgi:putative flavoprotein involved in K+ transport